MEIGNFAGGVNKRIFEIEKSCAGLILSGTFTASSSHLMSETDVLNTILGRFGSTRIEVTLVPKRGKTKYIYEPIPLTSLFEFISANEGAVIFKEVTLLTGTELHSSSYEFNIFIPFTETGFLPLQQDEIINVTFDSNSANSVGFTVSALESPVASNKYVTVQSLSMGQGVLNKTFDVKEFETILIPFDAMTASAVFRLNYTNGESPVISKDEFKGIGNHTNEMLYRMGKVVLSGFGNYAQLDVSAVDNIEIRRTSVTAFEMVVFDKDYHANMNLAESVNARLRNVSKQARLQKSIATFGNIKMRG